MSLEVIQVSRLQLVTGHFLHSWNLFNTIEHMLSTNVHIVLLLQGEGIS